MMAKFNAKTVVPVVTNKAGGKAYNLDYKTEIATILLSSFLNDQYYTSGNEVVNRIKQIVHDKNSDKLFLAKAAIYARNVFGMRSVSHVVMAELASAMSGDPAYKYAVQAVCRRVDDMTEILSYYWASGGLTKPHHALLKGLALATHNFNRYQLAKYKSEGKDVSLLDLVRISHPLSSNIIKLLKKANLDGLVERRQAITDLIYGKLTDEATYQAKKTRIGQSDATDDEKQSMTAEMWDTFVNNPKIEYFALLRNLNNISIEADSKTLDKALEVLTDEKLIKRSLVLPFRFAVARKLFMGNIVGRGKTATYNAKIVAALDKAMDIALSNIPDFKGETLVAVDVSGSMDTPATNANMPCSEIAGLFAAALFKKGADLMSFDTVGRYVKTSPSDSLATIAQAVYDSGRGGTSFSAIFQTASKKYDRIIVLSDMQSWKNNTEYGFQTYRTQWQADPYMYCVDLAGHGTTQFKSKLITLSGWSEKIFDLMAQAEQDPQVMINAIEAVSFDPQEKSIAVAKALGEALEDSKAFRKALKEETTAARNERLSKRRYIN
jgi:hypothetical protein